MKNVIIGASLALVAAVAATGVSAQDTGYTLEAGIAGFDISDENFGALSLTSSYRFNKNFGVEGNVAFGVTKKTYQAGNLSVDMKLDYAVGVYAVGYVPVSANTDILFRGGYSKLQVEGSSSGVNATADDDGLSYGVGVRYFPQGGVNGVRFDVTRYELEESVNAVSLTYVRKF